MNRRDFLAATAAVSLVAPLLPAGAAHAANSTAYTEGLEKTLLAEGKTVFLDFSATWCGTCKAQERVIDALRAENPAYDAGIISSNNIIYVGGGSSLNSAAVPVVTDKVYTLSW